MQFELECLTGFPGALSKSAQIREISALSVFVPPLVTDETFQGSTIICYKN